MSTTAAAVSLLKRLERLKTLAVFRQPHRHGANALNRRIERTQILKSFFKLLAVVKTGAEHKLGVELYSRLCKTVKRRQRLAGKAIFHHSAPKNGIGGVNRDVDGAYVHFDDPLDFMLGEIGQRDIVAEKEGKTGVVVLKNTAKAEDLWAAGR